MRVTWKSAGCDNFPVPGMVATKGFCDRWVCAEHAVDVMGANAVMSTWDLYEWRR